MTIKAIGYPYGLFIDTETGVISGTPTRSVVAPARWLGYWGFDGDSAASRVTGRPALDQASQWTASLSTIASGRLEAGTGAWQTRAATFNAPVPAAFASTICSRTRITGLKLAKDLLSTSVYCEATLQVDQDAGTLVCYLVYNLGGGDTGSFGWSGATVSNPVHLVVEVRSDRHVVVWADGVATDTGMLWPTGVTVGAVEFFGRALPTLSVHDDCCAIAGDADQAIVDALGARVAPTAAGGLDPGYIPWFGYWDLTTAFASQVVFGGPGAFNHYGARPPASFDGGEAALRFDPAAGTEWMGCAGIAPVTVDKLTIGMKVKNLEAAAALAILEVGPAFDSVEVGMSGNATSTYFNVVTSPAGDQAFPSAPILSDNAWHWVVMTVDFTTKHVDLYVDGVVYSSLTSVYAHASISLGSAFIHCWNNQKALIKAVFVVKDVLSPAHVAALSNDLMPDHAGRIPETVAYDVTISAANAFGSDTEVLVLSPPPPPSVDPARWVGAWDVEVVGEPNIVIGAPGAAFTTTGFSGYGLGTIVAGGPAASASCVAFPSTAVTSYQRGAAVTPSTLDAFTMAGWARGDAPGHAPGLRMFPSIDNNIGTVQFAVGIDNLYIGGTSYAVPIQPVDDGWHHYALTWDGMTGVTKAYRDGVEVWSGTTLVGTVTCGWCGFDSATAELNGFGDMFILHRDAFPAEAVAALAAGALPDSAGNLG